MSESCTTNIEGCLYFSANSLVRHLNEMADEAFKVTGIAPAYVYVMLVILEEPGLSQVRLAKRMNLKASTITRLVDKLIAKGFVERIHEGKRAFVHPTKAGEDFKVIIEQALKLLNDAYRDKLGADLAEKLTADIQNVNLLLEK